jgi:hypothetical protein
MRVNELVDVTYLPPSLKQLSADMEAVVKYDFKLLPHLKKHETFKESVSKEDTTKFSRFKKFFQK